MTSDAHGFYVSAGLLTPKHMKRIGSSLPEFLWLICHETKEAGEVLNGSPISIQQIADDLGQDERRTTRRHLDRLNAEKYIARERGRGGMYHFVVYNSKKWVRPADKDGQSDRTKMSAPDKNGHSGPDKTFRSERTKMSASPDNNVRCNKEVDKDKVDNAPRAKRSEVNPRHAPLRGLIQSLHLEKFRVKCEWDPSEAQTLNRLLKANPSWALVQMEEMVRNRFASERSLKRTFEWARSPRKDSAIRSRLEPFKKFVRMLRSHLEGILPWTKLQLSNGAVEGMNNKIKSISHRSFGFRKAQYFIAAIYHCCARLPLPQEC